MREAREQVLRDLQAARLKRVREGLGFLRERLNARLGAVEKQVRNFSEEIGTEPELEIYEAGDDGRDVGRPVSTRALYDVFEGVDGRKRDFTEDGYPKVSSVNERLEDDGYERASQEEIRRAYDRWKEIDDRRDRDEEVLSGNGGKPTQKVLHVAFAHFEGRKDDFTEDGYPKVGSINEWLESKNYSHTTQKDLRKAYDNWRKEEAEG
jgi:hypothetical protein